MLSLLKKVASVLLVISLALPLSKCTTTKEVGGKSVVTEAQRYGYKMVKASIDEVRAGKLNMLSDLFAVLSVFFLPIISLVLKERPQAIVCFASSFLAAFLLLFWVFLGSKVQIGGVLVVACWAVIFCTSCGTLIRLARNRALFKREPLVLIVAFAGAAGTVWIMSLYAVMLYPTVQDLWDWMPVVAIVGGITASWFVARLIASAGHEKNKLPGEIRHS